jgi:hypothetical protein
LDSVDLSYRVSGSEIKRAAIDIIERTIVLGMKRNADKTTLQNVPSTSDEFNGTLTERIDG